MGIGAEKKSKRDLREGEEDHGLPRGGPRRFCSMCCRTWGRSTRFPSFPRAWERPAIRCRCRKRMRCSIPRGKMLQTIMVSLGGRIAEELIFDDVTTGASQDIKQATAIARAMVTQYGMSEQDGHDQLRKRRGRGLHRPRSGPHEKLRRGRGDGRSTAR